MTRWLTAGAAAAALVLLPVGAAAADEDGADFQWPPTQSTHGRWVDLPEQLYEGTQEVPACGSTVTIGAGRVREVEYRAAIHGDTTVVDYRGPNTVVVERASDGARVEVDSSGPSTETYKGTSQLVLEFHGPSISYPVGDVETRAYERAGLPVLGYFTRGEIVEKYVFPDGDDPDADLKAARILKDTSNTKDLCRKLDHAAHHHR